MEDGLNPSGVGPSTMVSTSVPAFIQAVSTTRNGVPVPGKASSGMSVQ